MNHIKSFKKFENFESSNPLPITTKNFLTNYYSCDECDSLWKEYNKECDICKFCGSEEIEELQEDEWYAVYRSKNDSDKIEIEREIDGDTLINLYNLKNSKNRNYAN